MVAGRWFASPRGLGSVPNEAKAFHAPADGRHGDGVKIRNFSRTSPARASCPAKLQRSAPDRVRGGAANANFQLAVGPGEHWQSR
jgi:hypothetical protein